MEFLINTAPLSVHFILRYLFFFRKEFFFECLYFTEYDIRKFFFGFFGFWLKNKPSIKYVSNWGNGMGLNQNVYRCVQGKEGWKIGHKICTYKINGPKQMLWNIFCALVRPRILEHHHHQGRCSCFLPSKLRLFYPML